ncbi:MAG: dihydrodipicolinate synthase family protein, partial [Pseudomonadota bacterium]
MTALMADRLRGIHAATIAPMLSDFSLDEAALSDHLAAIAQVPGIRGFLINGHAGENFVLNAEEKTKVLKVAREIIAPNQVLCAGINAESSLAAAHEAEAAERSGADILLVFPPNSFALGHDPRAALVHHTH